MIGNAIKWALKNRMVVLLITDKSIQIISGLSATDSVAIQAQYLMDSESFIKVGQ